MKRVPVLALFALAVAFVQPAFPAEEAHDDHHAADQAGPAVKMHGVVNSINTSAGRVNITHDPVPELKWPTMKMNFKAQDPAMLSELKPGMTVDFEIQKMGNQYLVTRITPVQ
jgi:Cu(I)/Ag(I) efflux system periplasmic protein CusF